MDQWKGRSFLTLLDFSGAEIRFLLDLARKVKQQKRRGQVGSRFKGKNLALIFEKRSTRTRCSFASAFGEEGGNVVFLTNQDIHLGEKETIEDTARVLGRMFDAIGFRGYEQKTAETLARYSDIPVYNGLTDQFHPTQALADLMTLEENCGSLSGKKLVYLGDGRNNVAHSLLIGCTKMGVEITICAPPALQPAPEILALCRGFNPQAAITVTEDIKEGVSGADVVYTDVWISMGEEEKSQERLNLLRPYQVTADVMRLTAKPRVVFFHCLPAVRGNEVTDEVMEAPYSRVWDLVENRKHTIKAIMLATL